MDSTAQSAQPTPTPQPMPAQQPVMQPTPEKHSNLGFILLGLLVLVILALGAFSYKSGQKSQVTTPVVSQTPKPTATQEQASISVIKKGNTTDAQLNAQSADIDKSLSSVDQSFNDAAAGFNDTPDNLQ